MDLWIYGFMDLWIYGFITAIDNLLMVVISSFLSIGQLHQININTQDVVDKAHTSITTRATA